ncbi:MAG: hypothetical protein SWY16_13300 [Cyanobacteriota bacterium]|nr:hypothetical protein [Cyanobacteriota bacterium]
MISKRGFHFEFLDIEEAEEFYQVCKEQGKYIYLEGNTVVAMKEAESATQES